MRWLSLVVVLVLLPAVAHAQCDCTLSTITGTSHGDSNGQPNVGIVADDPGQKPGEVVLCGVSYDSFTGGIQASDTSWTDLRDVELGDGTGQSVFIQVYPNASPGGSVTFSNLAGFNPENWTYACVAFSYRSGVDGTVVGVNTGPSTSALALGTPITVTLDELVNVFAAVGSTTMSAPDFGALTIQQHLYGPAVGVVTSRNPPVSPTSANHVILGSSQYSGGISVALKCGLAPTASATATSTATATATSTATATKTATATATATFTPTPPPGATATATATATSTATATATSTATATPTATPTPGSFISNVIIIVPENHSYDNIYGAFPCTGGPCGAATASLSGGGTYTLTQAPNQYATDMCHTYACQLADLNAGAMNGFNAQVSCNSNPYQCLSRYLQSDEPNLWYLAQTFAMSDNAFPELGPSYGNHVALMAASEYSIISNPAATGTSSSWGCDAPLKAADCVGNNNPAPQCTGAGTCPTCTATTSAFASLLGGGTIFPCLSASHATLVDLMLAAGKTVGAYEIKTFGTSGYYWNAFDYFDVLTNGTTNWTNLVQNDTAFDAAAAAGTLPQLSFVTTSSGYSDHPNAPHCTASNYIVGKLNKLGAGSQWAHALVIVPWDDFGGTYDHVVPPTGFGIRTPFLVISPYSKGAGSGYISHVEIHTWGSIAKYIEEIFGLPSLGQEDATANDLQDMLDFTQSPLPASTIVSPALAQEPTSGQPRVCQQESTAP